MKILIADQISEAGLELLSKEEDFEVLVVDGLTRQELEEHVRHCDAIIVRSRTRIDRQLLEMANSLKVIGRAGSGIDNIDLEAATRRGIIVMNAAGSNSVTVAEYTLALILALARYVPEASNSLKAGLWERQKFVGVELKGKTLGIIGLGRIGTQVSRRAVAFQMKVLAYDPYVSAKVARDLGAELVSLDDLLARSDFISLHAPLTDSTRKMINRETIAKMKPGVRLINCARGELIDEDALYDALLGGRIAAAALDVFSQEPPADFKLIRLPNVIATPHIGASTYEAQENVGHEIAAQIRDYLKEGIIRNAVNFPSIPLDQYKKLVPFMRLGEMLGSFISQISEGRMNEIGIRYYGELTEIDTWAISSSVIKGVLKPILAEEHITLVNAVAAARERGINIVESRSLRARSFSNLISVKLRTSSREEWIEGTLLHQNNLRLVSVDGIDIEAPLEGTILFIRNSDQPGVIGQVGTILGKHNVNIANFALGRNVEAGYAVGVVNVDDPISDQILADLRSVPQIRFCRVVTL